MSVFDWLEGVPLPNGASPYDVVEIRYKNNRKAYVRSPQAVTAHVGDVVVIDLQPGHDVGVVSLTGELVKSQLKLRKIIRMFFVQKTNSYFKLKETLRQSRR